MGTNEAFDKLYEEIGKLDEPECTDLMMVLDYVRARMDTADAYQRYVDANGAVDDGASVEAYIEGCRLRALDSLG